MPSPRRRRKFANLRTYIHMRCTLGFVDTCKHTQNVLSLCTCIHTHIPPFTARRPLLMLSSALECGRGFKFQFGFVCTNSWFVCKSAARTVLWRWRISITQCSAKVDKYITMKQALTSHRRIPARPLSEKLHICRRLSG